MRRQRSVVGLVAAGLGLVLLGGSIRILTFKVVPQNAGQATDFSSVPARVDFNAPQLALTDLDGTSHALADFRGRVVLVNLWATWCPPCEAEMPILQAFFERHAGDGFVVIAIEDGDPKPQVVSFVELRRLTFPVWLDPTYQATDHAFRTSSLPSSYVLDRGGTVRLMWFGAINAENLEQYVVPLIKE